MKSLILSSGWFSCVVMGLVLLMFGCGCTRFGAHRAKARSELDEHSRALTTAVVETLDLQPAARRDEFTGLALKLAKEDQRVEGLPLALAPVQEILGVEPNVPEEVAVAKKVKATADLDRRFARIETLLAKERRAEERLVSLGAEVEAERNAERARWWKWGGSSALLLGGLAALCVFFPAAIPLAGRVLGLVVSHLPSMAGATGVVSVKAFDALVRAVERSKQQSRGHLKQTAGDGVSLGNQAGATGAIDHPGGDENWIAELHRNLSSEMDAAHKRLVRERKGALRLKD
jgi:hypothetical protein